jgi:hypothetical protein
MYNIPSRYYTHIQVLFEITPSGQVIPSQLEIDPFLRTPTQGQDIFAWIIRLILDTILFFDMIRALIWHFN